MWWCRLCVVLHIYLKCCVLHFYFSKKKFKIQFKSCVKNTNLFPHTFSYIFYLFVREYNTRLYSLLRHMTVYDSCSPYFVIKYIHVCSYFNSTRCRAHTMTMKHANFSISIFKYFFLLVLQKILLVFTVFHLCVCVLGKSKFMWCLKRVHKIHNWIVLFFWLFILLSLFIFYRLAWFEYTFVVVYDCILWSCFKLSRSVL